MNNKTAVIYKNDQFPDMLGYKKRTITAYLTCGAIVCFLSSGVFGKSPAGPLSFEVASIKQNKSASVAMGMFSSLGRLRISNYTLRNLIDDSYGLKRYQVLGGPGWLDTERYDIEAKVKGKANFGQMLSMVRTLLADRVQLRLHSEKRNLPVYELVVSSGGSKLGPSNPDSSGSTFRIREDEFTGHKVSIIRFADALAGQLQRPVLDDTKLTGTYNFSLKYSPESSEAEDPNSPSAASIFTAIQEQLGLKLIARKGPVDVMVIDGAERPTAN